MKKLHGIFHVNTYNIVGILLLLPLLIMVTSDTATRIAQRDLMHYNRPVYAFLSHTPLYYFPVLFTWAILFPLLAVLMNIIPLIKHTGNKRESVFSMAFVKKHFASLVILVAGIGFLAMIRLHDVLPCTVHGIMRFGIWQLSYILSYCRNA